MNNYTDNVLNVLDMIGMFNPEVAAFDRYTGKPVGRDHVEDMVDIFEDQYGGIDQYIDRGNLYNAIGTSLRRYFMGGNPDPYAGKFHELMVDAWERNVPLKEVMPVFEAYQNKFGILNEEGVNIAKDMINRELYKGINVHALRKLKSIKEGVDPFDEEMVDGQYKGWDIDLNRDGNIDILDVVKATQL